MSENWVGKTLGKVQIEAPLARGGVAEVYLGTHITLQRKVAVKILRNPGDDHGDALLRFQREARVVANLRHSNIVQVYDFDMVENDPYLVMEYVKGPSLSKYLYELHKKNERLELPQVARIITGVASALQYAHNRGVAHRDIKPGNILLISPTIRIEAGKPLPDDFEPVLTDFGLVRFLDSSRKTSTGVTAGTPAYMSPEQARGDPTDGRTDIYSLGVVLYEMLAGELPFDGESTMSILLKHVTEPPPPISGLSTPIKNVLERALAKHVKDRFQTPMDFANAFSALVDINPPTQQMDSLASLGPSTIAFHNAPTKLTDEIPKQKINWLRPAALGVIALSLGALLFFNGSLFPATEEPTSTVPPTTAMATNTRTSTSTSTSLPLPIILNTSVVLRFQDGSALADQAILEAQRMPAAPAGNKYEVWLANETDRISLGILTLDETGTGVLTYTDKQGENLAALYDHTEITMEPENDTDPLSSGLVAYAFTLPADGLVNVRYLLASYASTPNNIALIQGFYASIDRINQLALEMQSAYENNDEKQVLKNAEAILNLIAGKQSSNYKDWDGDGFIADGSDGFGLSLNGSNPGYFQAVYTAADEIVNSDGASEPMITYGEYLKVSVQNLAQWTARLENIARAIFEAPNQNNVSDLVTLAEQMLLGIDADNNGKIDPITGESGAQFAYQYAYSIANMPLVSVEFTFTPTPGSGISTDGGATNTSGGGGNNGSGSGSGAGGGAGGGATPEPTKRTGKPPTNTPKPKKE